MKYSYSFGEKASRIMLGTAYFGDGISQKDAYEIMDTFALLGGTHIDTARLYANGASEKIIGKWLCDRKPQGMHIFTKGGYYEPDKGEKPRINRKEIYSDLEKSLDALRQETIEFYWLHRDDESVCVEEIAQIMDELIKSGKIKKFGVSNWRSERIKKFDEYAKKHSLTQISASQIRFNPAYCLGERGGLVGMDKDEFSFYKDYGIPLVAYSSQAKGFFSKVTELGQEALSEKAKKRYLCEENLKKAEIMKELSVKYNCSVGAIVCGVMSSVNLPETFPVIGGSNVEQIKDSMRGGDICLTMNELKMIFEEYML